MLLDHVSDELARQDLPNALYDIEMAQAVADINWAAIGRAERSMHMADDAGVGVRW